MLDETTQIDFPFFQNQLEDMFGTPDTDGHFARDYLRIIDLGEFVTPLAHVLDFEGNPWSHRIYGNGVMAGPLKKAFRLICERGLAGELKTFDGCFNIRRMKGGNSWSVHSWGLALDFNAATNPFTRGPLITDFSPEFVMCFAESGFEWGGLWRSIKDAMHFQLPWTGDWRQSQNSLKPIPWVA